MTTVTRWVLAAALGVGAGCGGDERGRTSGFPPGFPPDDGANEGPQTGTDGTGDATDDSDASPTPSLDVAPAGDDGVGCSPDDENCCEPGQMLEHELLETFLAAYPPENMPKGHNAVKEFEPVVDGHMIAWGLKKVGGEIVDPDNGGVSEENILEGRQFARDQAELAMPPGTTLLAVREDPVIKEVLGGGGMCNGVGWAWGSILFEAPDAAVSEVIYLYVGYCANGDDAEGYFYSDEPVEVCHAPG